MERNHFKVFLKIARKNPTVGFVCDIRDDCRNILKVSTKKKVSETTKYVLQWKCLCAGRSAWWCHGLAMSVAHDKQGNAFCRWVWVCRSAVMWEGELNKNIKSVKRVESLLFAAAAGTTSIQHGLKNVLCIDLGVNGRVTKLYWTHILN